MTIQVAVHVYKQQKDISILEDSRSIFPKLSLKNELRTHT